MTAVAQAIAIHLPLHSITLTIEHRSLASHYQGPYYWQTPCYHQQHGCRARGPLSTMCWNCKTMSICSSVQAAYIALYQQLTFSTPFLLSTDVQTQCSFFLVSFPLVHLFLFSCLFLSFLSVWARCLHLIWHCLNLSRGNSGFELMFTQQCQPLAVW